MKRKKDNKPNNKNIAFDKGNNNNNFNDNKKISKDSQDNININDKNEKLSNNELLNLNKNPSNDVSSNPNSSNNINNFSNNLNSNTNKSNTNYAFNFFGVSNINNNTLEDNSSLNSSKNELSSKNIKLGNVNNRVSNLSSSSFGKNFVLKSEICKSTFHKENRYIGKNTYSGENPIINYYTKDLNGKNFGNFYLFTDRKSIEEIDQNQYQNFSLKMTLSKKNQKIL